MPEQETQGRFNETAVLNTSSLSSLFISNCIDLLPRFFESVYVPQAVLDEFSVRWNLPYGIIIEELSFSEKARAAMIGLGNGENEAIILAQDLEATLIVDEKSARKVAKKFGMSLLGSLGFVRLAFISCLIDRRDFESRVRSFQLNRRAKPNVISWGLSATKPN